MAIGATIYTGSTICYFQTDDHGEVLYESVLDVVGQIPLIPVFQCLKMANLKLKPTKVHLFQYEITFLGHRNSIQAVAMDESKVTEIVQWPAQGIFLKSVCFSVYAVITVAM